MQCASSIVGKHFQLRLSYVNYIHQSFRTSIIIFSPSRLAIDLAMLVLVETQVLLLLLVELCCGSVRMHYQFPEEWETWKTQHGKNYSSQLEDLDRHLVWVYNKKFIETHNANQDYFGFSLGMNSFGDMTDREYMEQYNGFERGSEVVMTGDTFRLPAGYNESSLPSYVNWRKKGVVSKVKRQGNCGSCYAFSAVGALESAAAIANNRLVYLSEQNIVDCSGSYGNKGCNGGDTISSFKYIIENGGIDKSSYYRYKATKGQCKYSSSYIGAREKGVVGISRGDESSMRAAVALKGPVSAAVDARSTSFRFYRRGVFRYYQCSSSTITHAVLVTGYGKTSGRKYWRIKNSWGTSWGSSGYMLLSRDYSNHCGIATHSFYPTL